MAALFLAIIITLLSPATSYPDGPLVGPYKKAVVQGGVTVLGLADSTVEAEFTGGVLRTISLNGGAYAIVAVDLEKRPGTYRLTARDGDLAETEKIRIVPGDYGTDRLRLPGSMVELDEDTMRRVEAEAALLGRLWEKRPGPPLFDAPFVMPVTGRVTGRFGARRILNGLPRSPHGGVDIAAPEGTPVVAANRGQVAFVGNFYFIGRFVVLDHGLGIYTLYCHLKDIKVGLGDMVERKGAIGTVGSTGRATGPHLHFSVRIGPARVGPASFFKALNPILDRAAARSYDPASG